MLSAARVVSYNFYSADTEQIPTDVKPAKPPKRTEEGALFDSEDLEVARELGYPTWSWAGWAARASYRIVLDSVNAGHGIELDPEVTIELRNSLDAEALKSTSGQTLSPALFSRICNRGVFDLSAPSISIKGFHSRFGDSIDGRIDSVDGTDESYVFATSCYFEPHASEDNPVRLIGRDSDPQQSQACGVTLGAPLWMASDKRNNTRFVLLKRIARRPYEQGRKTGMNRYLNFEEGPDLVAVLVIWVSGTWAERLSLALIEAAVWDRAGPTIASFQLL